MAVIHQLAPHLKQLRLSGILETLDVRQQQAVDGQWSHLEFLERLLQDEVERRAQKQLDLRLRRASLNSQKTLDTFDFTFNPTISRQQVLDHVKGADGVHLGPLHPKDIDISGIKSLKGLNRQVILDIQGLVRTVRNGNVYLAGSQQLIDALGVSQIVKANRHEYDVMLDFFQTDLMTIMQRFDIREFVVTSGASGGFVQESTAPATPYAAAPAKSDGDPTGAGDIFMAAYVVEHLLKQRSVADACQYAASLVAQQFEGKFIKEDELRIKTPLRITK